MKHRVQEALRQFGYEIHRVENSPQRRSESKSWLPANEYDSVNPVWPLPCGGGLTANQIQEEFSKHAVWRYAYEFSGGLAFPRHSWPGQPPYDPRRPLQRFRHLMPYLLEANKGSLQGKRVLDIACNSGFWAMQFALLGAEVVGFDARPDLIEEANLVKRVVGVKNVDFRVLDFWDMGPQSLGDKFDIVLSLGILYHLPKPIEALRLTKSMAREYILLDTEVSPSPDSVLQLRWEEPAEIRSANRSGIVAIPSKGAIDLILREIGMSESIRIPLRTKDMPYDYLGEWRASWLIRV